MSSSTFLMPPFVPRSFGRRPFVCHWLTRCHVGHIDCAVVNIPLSLHALFGRARSERAEPWYEQSGSFHPKDKNFFLEQVKEALRRLQNDVELIQNNLSASLVSLIRRSTVSQFSPFTPNISSPWYTASSTCDTSRHQALYSAMSLTECTEF